MSVCLCVCVGGGWRGGQRETENERAEIFNHIRQRRTEESDDHKSWKIRRKRMNGRMAKREERTMKSSKNANI